MTTFRYPCTGHIHAQGFGSYLEHNLLAPRYNLTAFAEELGQRFGAKYLTLVNSGSSANLVAALTLAETLKAQGKPLEAIMAAFTFPTTISAMLMAGFSVRLVDTEEDGFNLCPQALKIALEQKSASLICVTHFLGFPAQMSKIKPLAQQYGALILQDACETLDLKAEDGSPMHTLGDLTTWSFYHPHHLSSYGGGATISTTPEHHHITDSLSHWGRACTCHIDPATCGAPQGASHNFTYICLGLNVEMSELNACFGRFQLQDWETIEAERKARYAILFNALYGLPTLKTYSPPRNNGSPFVFPITCLDGKGSNATSHLGFQGIEGRSLMGGAMIEQHAFRHLDHDGNLNAKAMAQKSFFVGCHQTLSRTDTEEMARLIRQTLS